MSTSGKQDHYWRCDCGGGHFLSITWWLDTPDVNLEGYLAVEGDFWTGWRDRVAQAWRVLRNGCSETRVGVVLDPAKAAEIAACLNSYASDVDAARSTET